MNEQEFAELSAGHALHALSSDDERRYAAALAAHPEWATIVDLDAATAAALADGTAAVTPPASVRDALLASISSAPQPESVSDPSEPRPVAAPVATKPTRGRSRSWFALAASIVLVLAIGVSGLIVAQQLGRSPAQITLAQIQEQSDAQTASAQVAGGGTATAHWSGALGQAVLVTDGLPAIASDRVFELWYVRDGTAEPAGVFTSASGDTTAVLTGTMHAGDTIAVTIEQSGGSPNGKPTTKPIVAIPTA